MRHYYQDRQTGSIYSAIELASMLVCRQFTMEELPQHFEVLPYSTSCLLEQAEAIAARADQSGHQRQLDP